MEALAPLQSLQPPPCRSWPPPLPPHHPLALRTVFELTPPPAAPVPHPCRPLATPLSLPCRPRAAPAATAHPFPPPATSPPPCPPYLFELTPPPAAPVPLLPPHHHPCHPHQSPGPPCPSEELFFSLVVR
ncbi:uncharacterized protein LOC134764166 [Penaeus indicus]|uniref:uncharacterized protein LOC134764166 n=1 Tax=Penaeus indicus TaxID=29960 RepID=UPI00300CAF60